jgi:hypothetical protein
VRDRLSPGAFAAQWFFDRLDALIINHLFPNFVGAGKSLSSALPSPMIQRFSRAKCRYNFQERRPPGISKQMSRHSSGRLEAMRVMSLKPPAQKALRSTPSTLVASSVLTKAYAAMCGKWLTTAKTLSCRPACMISTLAPMRRQSCAILRRAARRVLFVGVSMQRCPRKIFS